VKPRMRTRRQFLKAGLGLCGLMPAVAWAQGPRSLARGVYLVDAGTNVVVLDTDDGFVLVDTGSPGTAEALLVELAAIAPGRDVSTAFNTHYHLENTGGNARMTRAGARVLAHENTRIWMATDVWVPAEDRYREARPGADHPTETFYTDGSMTVGSERIDYGYLIEAHTSGDIFVFFRDSNVLVAGDVASPARDPQLDYFTGAWIGGRGDAMTRLVEMSDSQTVIVPTFGPPVSRAELEAERDVIEQIYERTVDRVRQGETVDDMFAAGVMDGLSRTWDEPYAFLYDVHKGLWAHHNKLAPNVV